MRSFGDSSAKLPRQIVEAIGLLPSGGDEKEVWRWRRAAQPLSAENVDVASGPQGAATACVLTCTSASKSMDNTSSGNGEEEKEAWR